MPLKYLFHHHAQKLVNKNLPEGDKIKMVDKCKGDDPHQEPIVYNRVITRAKSKELKNIYVRNQEAAEKVPERRVIGRATERPNIKRGNSNKRKFAVASKQENVGPHFMCKIPKMTKRCFVKPYEDIEYPTPELLTVDLLNSELTSDPYYCQEYADSIVNYMMKLELKLTLPFDFLSNSPEISAKPRSVLVNWLNLVHSHENIFVETFLLAVSMIDRCLERQPITMDTLQLLGIVCLLIASKYEEKIPLSIAKLTYFSAYSCCFNDIVVMEWKVLMWIDFQVFSPTPIHYLRLFIHQLENKSIDKLKLEHPAVMATLR